MDEEYEEASDNIRFRVWSGYYDQAEVFEIVTDETGGADDEWLRDAIDQEFGRKHEAERGWATTTDCDRLNRVFESLYGRGILTRHRCGMTIQDGFEVIDRLYNDAVDKRSEFVGYCFYHLQDMEAAMWGKVGLWLAFGSFPPTRERTAQVGQLVREEFERAGFTVDWDGASESRLLLKGFRWQRRNRASI